MVVLIHGAWFDPSCWDAVIAELGRLGTTAVAVELPFTGFDADVAAAREAIEAAGPNVIVAAHSYGGCVASAAARDNPDVARLVYVAAFLTEPGEHPFTILADYHGELLDALVITDTGVGVDPDRAREVFFGDRDDEHAAQLAARLRSMPLNAAEMTYAGDPAWKSTTTTYVVCTADRAIPVQAQRWMAAEICTSHTFADRVDTLARAGAAGLSPCSGAIFGMGESDEDVVDVAIALRGLDPDSVPVNFLIPFEGTPLGNRWDLTPQRCIRILALFRFFFPDVEVRFAGGREIHLRSLQPLALHLANSIFLGDYLTSEGQPGVDDHQMITDAGFTVEGAHEQTLPQPRHDLVALRRRGAGTDQPANA
ncbi:alpha/beta fold hydrolase [Nocardia jiangxiensis]|uniref:alpha/beta fold hydrolase n=1 Tax=Nocardia jiangxiensis TaxID=282685 RepID=UPI000A05C7C2|nr:alpha/beta fold hydrolase [Nocardia jiangxiensis]